MQFESIRLIFSSSKIWGNTRAVVFINLIVIIFSCKINMYVCRDSAVGIATLYRLDRAGIESRWWARFSAPVQTDPGAHPSSYTMCTGSFPRVKRPERGVDNPPTSSTEVKERVELYFYSTPTPSDTTFATIRLDEWSARSRKHSQGTDICAAGEFRNLNPNKRKAADPRLIGWNLTLSSELICMFITTHRTLEARHNFSAKAIQFKVLQTRNLKLKKNWIYMHDRTR